MIKVDRLPQPRILRRQGANWKRKLTEARTAKDREKAQLKYRHPQVKAALIAMFQGKCAYCESKIVHIDYGHIEHFKPKSTYPLLTFAWANLLLACGIRNGSEHKGDRFPLAAKGGPLVNPSWDNPADHFDFYFDPLTRLASVYGKTQRGRITEEILGLNRPALRSYRSRQVARLVVLARLAESDLEARELLEQARRADAEYAAFARALFPPQR